MRAISFFHCLAVALLANSATGNTIPSLQGNLIADYSFNGNANDQSANANNGIAHDATLTSDRFGNADSAYSFNGSTSYIELPDTSVFSSLSYTVSLWFDPLALPNHLDHDHEAEMLISKGRNDFEIHLGTPPFADSGIRFLPRLANPSTGQGWDAQGTGITTDAWRNIIAVYDGPANEAHLYLDGIELTTTYFSGPDGVQPSVPARIGMRYEGGVPFNGAIDDIQIYDTAITGNDAADLFRLQSQSSVPEGGSSMLLIVVGLCSLNTLRSRILKIH